MSTVAPHWETRGNVHFKGTTSGAEVDWLHAQVLREEIRLNQILENNSSRLIRLGVGEKVEAAHVATKLASMFANWAINGMNPSAEKIKLCEERIFATVGPYTQFQVGENIMAKLEGKESPDISVLHIGMAHVGTGTDRLSTGEQSIWLEVGTRLMKGGEAVSFAPKDIVASGISLDEEQLYEIGLMVDSFTQDAAYGELPHLATDGCFNSLIVPGLSLAEA